MIPVTLETMRESIARACSVTLGYRASMGAGRHSRYAEEWQWITETSPVTSAGHRSIMWRVDGFGRWHIAERTNWNAKARHYETVVASEGKLPNRRGLQSIGNALRARAAMMHNYTIGTIDSYQDTPWKE